MTPQYFTILFRRVIISFGGHLPHLIIAGGIIFPWFIMIEGVTVLGESVFTATPENVILVTADVTGLYPKVIDGP